MVRDNSKCILCRRCSAACANLQDIASSAPMSVGFKTHIGCAFENKLADVACVSCGQCIVPAPPAPFVEKTRPMFESPG